MTNITDSPNGATEEQIASLFEDVSDHHSRVVALAKSYLESRLARDNADKVAADATKQLVSSEQELLRVMRSAGVKSLKVEHLGKMVLLTQKESTYYSAPAGSLDIPEFLQWLEAAGGKDLIKNTIHHATFSSFCKELKESGDMPLHKLVNVLDRRSISMRKG